MHTITTMHLGVQIFTTMTNLRVSWRYLGPILPAPNQVQTHNPLPHNQSNPSIAHINQPKVIVIQLSGRKRWSVAREPSIYLSNKDQKRKPSNAELEKIRRYSDFTLCPGDILYIPRGYVHNASTIEFDKLPGNGSNGGGGRLDLNDCPSYPKEAPSAEHLAAHMDGPSLHITFGLLQSNDATIETLLHFALDSYFDGKDKIVAIPANTACPSSDQVEMD